MARPFGFRRSEAGAALVLLALALYVVWTARTMPAGTVALPGPGFFPTALGLLLAAVSIGLLLRLRLPDDRPVDFTHPNIGIALAALAGVALAFEQAGAVPTLAAFLFVLFRVLGRIAWWKAALLGAAGAGLTWLVFATLLGVSLPGA